MKNAVIAARKSTWRSKLDLSYLNEVSLTKRQQQQRLGHRIGNKLKQFTSYASKEFTGSVHAGGFLHDMVVVNPDGTGTAPTHLPNDERERRILRAWTQVLKGPCLGKGAKKDVIQHRLVFSMSGEMYNACLKAQLNPDRVLHLMMTRTLRKFREHFHYGDRIGYAYGFHHDTDNLHVHVALCPRTIKGFYVGYSKPKYSNNAGRNRNQYEFVKQCFEQQNQAWGELLTSPAKLRELQKKQRSYKLFLTPTFQPLRHRRDNNYRPAAVAHLRRQHDHLVQLKAYMDSLERELLRRRFIRLARSSWGRVAPLPPLVRQMAKLLSGKTPLDRMRQLRTLYFQKRKEYLRDLKQFQKTKGTYAVISPIQTRNRPVIQSGIGQRQRP